MSTDSAKSPATLTPEQKNEVEANNNYSLRSECQNSSFSSLSLSDEHGQGSDNETYKVQTSAQEYGFPAREESIPNHSKDERSGFAIRVREKNMKPLSRDRLYANSVPICYPYTKHIAEKNEKLENKLEQVVQGTFVSSKKPQAASQSYRKHPSFDAEMNNHVSFDAEMNNHVSLAAVVGEANDLVEVLFPSPQREKIVCSGRKLIVLDINGLLADIVYPAPKDCRADINILKRAIFKRPFCFDFLKFCFDTFDVGIWSSRLKKNIDKVVDYLLGDLKHKLLFCWDMSHCTESGFHTLENQHKPMVFKELRKLWENHDLNLPWKKGDYNESNTLLVDDSPYKALLNPVHTAIFPYSYKYENRIDTSLGPGGDIRAYLEELATVENVQKYVEQHPFGQRAIDETCLFWGFYSKVLRNPSGVPRGYNVPATASPRDLVSHTQPMI